jgi:DNA-binding MarR family transcriptional regulator
MSTKLGLQLDMKLRTVNIKASELFGSGLDIESGAVVYFGRHMEAIERIAELYPAVMRVMGRFRSLVQEGMDLSYNQFKMLLVIYDKGKCPLNAVAADLDIAMSSASEMVDKLVNLELVERSVDAESRRRVVINTTEKGRNLIGELQSGIIENYRVLLGKLSEKDQKKLVRALETLVEIVEKLD